MSDFDEPRSFDEFDDEPSIEFPPYDTERTIWSQLPPLSYSSIATWGRLLSGTMLSIGGICAGAYVLKNVERPTGWALTSLSVGAAGAYITGLSLRKLWRSPNYEYPYSSNEREVANDKRVVETSEINPRPVVAQPTQPPDIDAERRRLDEDVKPESSSCFRSHSDVLQSRSTSRDNHELTKQSSHNEASPSECPIDDILYDIFKPPTSDASSDIPDLNLEVYPQNNPDFRWSPVKGDIDCPLKNSAAPSTSRANNEVTKQSSHNEASPSECPIDDILYDIFKPPTSDASSDILNLNLEAYRPNNTDFLRPVKSDINCPLKNSAAPSTSRSNHEITKQTSHDEASPSECSIDDILYDIFKPPTSDASSDILNPNLEAYRPNNPDFLRPVKGDINCLKNSAVPSTSRANNEVTKQASHNEASSSECPIDDILYDIFKPSTSDASSDILNLNLEAYLPNNPYFLRPVKGDINCPLKNSAAPTEPREQRNEIFMELDANFMKLMQ